jgi:zinc protease
MDKAFLVLEDWAQNLSFDPAEIDKERGIIIEEWRLGRGADARMRDRQFPILFKGARYADRLPIGKTETIEKFKHDALKRFYDDWYRPDLMAVIAVGDFDKAAVEGLIRQHFGPIPAAKVPRLRTIYDVPDQPQTLYAFATDKEATMATISVYNKLPLRERGTVGVYRQTILDRLAVGMLSRRLFDLTQKPDAPFIMAEAERSILVRTKEAAILNAISKEGCLERTLDMLLTEAARVSQFGFTATEFEREKLQALRTSERNYTEKDKSESADLAAEFVRNFTQHEPMPGPALEYALYLRFLPEITIEQVNKAAMDWMDKSSRVVIVSAPEKDGVIVPDEAKLAAEVKRVETRKIGPYVDTITSQALLDKLPEPGKITKATAKEAFGITEWDLSNGVKVVLKPTKIKQDEIIFRAFSFGGYQLADDRDLISARIAAPLMSVMGVGKFSAIGLQKLLAGKIASVGAQISETDEGLIGSGSPKDLETMFQLIYLNFTQPRADREVFAAFLAQVKTLLANQQKSPEWSFNETLQRAIAQDHPRARPMTAEMVNQIDLDKSLAFYKDRFADASDFTFVFVGSFTLDMIKPFVERYLASLPALRRNETWKDVGIRPPKGVVEKTVLKGIEPKSQAAIIFTGPFQYDREHRVAVRALSLVLETRLREVLREDLSGTYSISISSNYLKIPTETYVFPILFGCNPERTNELVKVIFREIDNLKKRGPSEKEVGDTKTKLIRDFETQMQKNMFLLVNIYLKYEFKEDLGKFFDLSEYYKTLNVNMIWDAARMYLNTENYVKVLLLPEAKSKVPAEKR